MCEMRTKKGWKRLILLKNAVYIKEWGSVHKCLGNTNFHLKSGTSFYLAKPFSKEKVTLRRNESLHRWHIRYFLDTYVVGMLLKGLEMEQGGWPACCRRSPLGMSCCDLVIWLKSSNTQSVSEGLIIYSYTVRCFQEWFPCSILISTL